MVLIVAFSSQRRLSKAAFEETSQGFFVESRNIKKFRTLSLLTECISFSLNYSRTICAFNAGNVVSLLWSDPPFFFYGEDHQFSQSAMDILPWPTNVRRTEE